MPSRANAATESGALKAEATNKSVEPANPVNAPAHPSALASAATAAQANATTSGAAQSGDERAEFTTASSRPNETAPAADGHGDDDDGAPIGPSEEEEAAFLAEDSLSHFSGGASLGRMERGVEAEEKHSGPLPSLEELRGRIPPQILGLMEDLFRAKPMRVTRVPASALKSK